MNFTNVKRGISFLVFLVQLIFITLHANAQSGSIEGRVVDARNQSPLPGVNVGIEGTTLGAATNADGQFRIGNVPAGPKVISASAVGFNTVKREVEVTEGDVTQLSIRLSARTLEMGEIVVSTERAQDYRTYESVSALKVETSLINTPAAISTVPQEVFEDQQVTEIGDAIRNVSGITKRGEFLGAYEYFSARGFALSNTTNYLKNGRQFFHLASPPMEIVERLEVLKGPSSALYGQAEPGGMINMVTKKPTANPYQEVTLRTDNFGSIHPSLDVSGPISESLGYRVVLAYDKSESFRNVVDRRRIVGAGILQWDFAEASTMTLHLDAHNNRNTQDTGIPLVDDEVADVPRDRFVNLPWSLYEADVADAGAEVEHRFNESWKIRSWFNYQYYERHRIDAQPRSLDPATGDFRLRARDRVNRWDTYTFDLNLIGSGTIFGVKHKFLAGINYVRQPVRFDETAENEFFTVNLYDQSSVYETSKPDFVKNPAPNRALDVTTGLYVQDQISIVNSLDALLSLRYDQVFYQFRLFDQPTNEALAKQEDAAFSPRFGLVYRPTQQLSLYSTYTKGFVPNRFVTQGQNAGDYFEPQRGVQYELGAKTKLFNEQLDATLTLFHLTKENITNYIPEQDITRLTGEQLHRGVELDVAGAPLQGLQLIGSITYLDAEIVEDKVNEGNTPEYAPATSGSLWSTYTVQGGLLERLRLGAGLFFEGERQGDNANSFTLDSYTRLDAMVAYPLRLGSSDVTLQLNVENLTDELYYTGGSRLGVMPGPTRTAKLTLRATF